MANPLALVVSGDWFQRLAGPQRDTGSWGQQPGVCRRWGPRAGAARAEVVEQAAACELSASPAFLPSLDLGCLRALEFELRGDGRRPNKLAVGL